MRTFLFVLIGFVFLTPCFAQTEVLLDSVSLKNPSDQEIVIRCGGTLTSNRSPLFIVDGRPMAEGDFLLNEIDPEIIASINVLKGSHAIECFGSQAAYGVVLISTKTGQGFKASCREYPFNTHKIYDNWVTTQDIYNSIQSRVPGVTITTNANLKTTNIRMRGNDNTIVIVDGIRYDASILNTLNPLDIDHITVVNSAVSSQYLIND